jgi:hypothetical protein
MGFCKKINKNKSFNGNGRVVIKKILAKKAVENFLGKIKAKFSKNLIIIQLFNCRGEKKYLIFKLNIIKMLIFIKKKKGLLFILLLFIRKLRKFLNNDDLYIFFFFFN